MKSFSDNINKEMNLPEIPDSSSIKSFSNNISRGTPDNFSWLEDIMRKLRLHPQERKEPVYQHSPVQPGGGIRDEAWNERAAKVTEELKKENPVELKFFNVDRLNRLVANLGAAIATGTGGDFSFHDKILREMGYSREDIKKAQNIRKDLPPWGVTRFEIKNLVTKSGWSVNQALKYLKEHKGLWKKKVDVVISGRKAFTPEGVEIKGEFYHKDKGWY